MIARGFCQISSGVVDFLHTVPGATIMQAAP